MRPRGRAGWLKKVSIRRPAGRSGMRGSKSWRILFLTMVVSLFFVTGSRAKPVGQDEAETAAKRWVDYIVKHDGCWGNHKEASAGNIEPFFFEDELVGYVLDVAPAGFVLVPADDELPPVKAYSTDSAFDPKSAGFADWLGTELRSLIVILREESGEKPVFSPINARLWLWLRGESAPGVSSIPAPVLLESRWSQGNPYNRFCPEWEGTRCVVGCVATAHAQIMKYWSWPPQGTGSHSYTTRTHRFNLSVDFEHPYDWENMPNDIGFATEEQKNEVARLGYEVGVAVDMDYDPQGSGPATNDLSSFLIGHFSYGNDLIEEDYPGDDEEWFAVFKEEVDLGRPLFYVIMAPTVGHAVVVDGYRTDQGNMVHINMGWGGSYTAYYATNNILDFTEIWWQSVIKNIHPNELQPLEALSTASSNGGCAPIAVYFAGQGKKGLGPFQYQWDFGDGSIADGRLQSHIFTEEGSFTVTLTVTDEASQTATDSHLLVNVSAATGFSAAVQAANTSGKIPLTVNFEAVAMEGTPPYTYVWDFGDGTTETVSSPTTSHTYTKIGAYTAVLTVKDSSQAQATAAGIAVAAKPSGPIPSVTGAVKMASPFRLKIMGSNFIQNSKVRINGVEVPAVKFKNEKKLIAKKGASLKSMCPMDTEVKVTVENEEGNFSNEFSYTRY